MDLFIEVGTFLPCFSYAGFVLLYYRLFTEFPRTVHSCFFLHAIVYCCAVDFDYLPMGLLTKLFDKGESLSCGKGGIELNMNCASFTLL